jgi:heat shock protein HslJ
MTPNSLRPALALAIALALAGCATSSSQSTSSEPTPTNTGGQALEGIDWRLVSATDSKTAAAAGAGAATLRFEADRFSMRGPCNRHSGAWKRDGDSLSLGGEEALVASTKMMCPPEIMRREQAFLAAMTQPFTIAFEGSSLRLEAGNGSTWRFDSRDLPPAEGRERIVHVAGQRAPCTGVAPMLCLQIRTQPGAAWELHYGEIEGFDWQVGVEYVIRVREYAVANPPADGSSLRWVLEEVLERSP